MVISIKNHLILINERHELSTGKTGHQHEWVIRIISYSPLNLNKYVIFYQKVNYSFRLILQSL